MGRKATLSQRVAVHKTDCVGYVGFLEDMDIFTALEIETSQYMELISLA